MQKRARQSHKKNSWVKRMHGSVGKNELQWPITAVPTLVEEIQCNNCTFRVATVEFNQVRKKHRAYLCSFRKFKADSRYMERRRHVKDRKRRVKCVKYLH